MLWTSAGGVPVGCAVMNTAVPCTRTGCVASTVATNSLSGSARAAKRSATSRRPVLHVVMNVKRIVATASVTHPPCSSFKAFAPKNARSIVRKRSMTASAACLGQRQRSVITGTDDPDDPERGNGEEPNDHDGPEKAADPVRPESLDRKEA